MRLADFDALSFDCYGTLIDWEAGIAAVLTPWAADQGIALTTQDLLERYAIAEAQEEERTPTAPYPSILGAAMAAVGAALGVQVTAAEREQLATSVPDWPAFSDSADALDQLSRRYKLIILSNVDRTSFAGSNARLRVRFDGIVTAEAVGSYKPSPRNFEALLETARELGVGSGRLLHVAQSLFHDHVPAKSMGLPTAWIDRRGARHGWGATPQPRVDVQPDWTFRSMAELAAAAGVADNSA